MSNLRLNMEHKLLVCSLAGVGCLFVPAFALLFGR